MTTAVKFADRSSLTWFNVNLVCGFAAWRCKMWPFGRVRLKIREDIRKLSSSTLFSMWKGFQFFQIILTRLTGCNWMRILRHLQPCLEASNRWCFAVTNAIIMTKICDIISFSAWHYSWIWIRMKIILRLVVHSISWQALREVIHITFCHCQNTHGNVQSGIPEIRTDIFSFL